MKIYNTLTKRVEAIVPLKANQIKMYSCGPTVYRYIHIGNLRTFTIADWIRRAFEYRGFQVVHIKNITDVGHMRQEVLDRGEDKMIAQARKEGKTSQQIAQFYTEAFHADEAALNILPAHMFPHATEHIPEMIAVIKGLLAKGIAYEVDGYVYYDTKRFSGYGKLSGNQLEHMLAGVREGTDTLDRRHPEDFPLWKVAEPGREMAWDSPWGRGFPGWHIECSAMSMKYLGTHFDLHTGGVDNIFPHHEDEIAQSEGFSGQQFVNYWVHAQHLLADGQKMAKSTGNTYTRSEVEARGFDPMALRYFYTTALYRSRLNFTFRALDAAQTSLERMRDLAYQLFMQSSHNEHLFSDEPLEENPWHHAFLMNVENDLNIPRAMAVVWAMLQSKEYDPTTKLRLLLNFDRILGFDFKGYLQSDQPQRKYDPQVYLAAVPIEIAKQVQEREALRHRGSYQQADIIRHELNTVGYEVRDTDCGTLVLPRCPEDDYMVVSSSSDAPDYTSTPDFFEFSVNLLAHNSREDLERCIQSICRHVGHRQIELVIIDNGSTDDTLPYLRHLARQTSLATQHGQSISLQVLFADHNMGFAAGRNTTMQASRGRYIILMDTSIELKGDMWEPLALALADRSIGIAGPYGLVTEDLREFYESAGPDVDAIEGYLMAFRRDVLSEIGWIEEKFRFYRLMDIYFSFLFKTAGYRIFTMSEVAARIEKHPHREWYSLSEDERVTKSKKNYDLFRARWHHGESLLTVNAGKVWGGHDHPYHLEGRHKHVEGELPPDGSMHTHTHQHWPDHAHEHPHFHSMR